MFFTLVEKPKILLAVFALKMSFAGVPAPVLFIVLLTEKPLAAVLAIKLEDAHVPVFMNVKATLGVEAFATLRACERFLAVGGGVSIAVDRRGHSCCWLGEGRRSQ